MTGAIVGTPHYMSPEQVQGHPVDGRSDQFSLAVVAYEALTGEKPYTGEHLTTVVYKIVTEEPPAPHRLNPSLSGPIDTILRKALAKKPDARFKNCQEFIDSLEKACAATKGWKLMPRGGSLNEPTVADVPAAPRSEVTLPRGVKPKRLGDTTVTSARAKDRTSSFVTFLLAVLVTGGLIALIAVQAPPWLSSIGKQPESPPQQAGTPPQTAPEQPKVEPPAAPKDPDKPSPLAPAERPPAAPEVAKKDAAPPTGAAQPIAIISSPGGGKAMLDSRPDAVCTTPCSLDAAPGRHTISVSLDGFQTEFREVYVTNGPLEMPAVVLRARGGALMLSSDPPGANILVDGKSTGKITPARIDLAPGSYKITVERDGRQSSQNVQVISGISILKMTL
jgi:serine/threonine-protein kinase